jgi:4-amino-4-deoxy-L-arabinose transferase-like glycosyltransferase
MSAMTGAGHRRLQLAERLTAALADPARRERAVVGILLAYVALWTLYAVIAKGSQDLHSDMAEQAALAHELALGYSKHPPLAMAVVWAWFKVFPAADWAYYLLAASTAGMALWIAWRLFARFLDGEKRVVALALLMLIPFFNFHALKFNQNTVLMPLWAAATLFFLRSFETRRVLDAALAGVAAAATMYGKYWSVVLLAGLGTAALIDSRRRAYFRSAAPWVTIAAGALAIAPHVVWLVTHDFAPLSYAFQSHGGSTFAAALRSVPGYVAGAAAYVALPVLIAFLATRPDRAAVADMAWPADPERRLAAAAFWATLAAPIVIAVAASFALTSLWTMSAWTLLPVLLLSSPLIAISRRDAVRVVALACIFPFAAIAAAPVVAFSVHRAGVAPAAAHSSLLAEPVERLWRETSERPLRLFAGYEDFGYGVAFYVPGRPLVVNALDGLPPPDLDARIARDGIALVCPADAAGCVSAANARATRAPAGKRREVEVSRRFLGIEGAPARYLIVTLPPRQ